MQRFFLLGLAAARLVASVPTPQEAEAVNPNDPWAGVIDPWGIYGHMPDTVKRANIEVVDNGKLKSKSYRIGELEISHDDMFEHAKRATEGNIENYKGMIPSCDDAEDPSLPDTPKPEWPVNHGFKIPKNGEHDQCTRGKWGDHCWTEYYLVEAAIEYFQWRKSGSAVNCPTEAGSSCSLAIASLQQSCTTTGTVDTSGWDYKILEGSLGLALDTGKTLKGDVGLSTGITHSWSSADYNLRFNCAADTSTVTCTWTNPTGEKKDLCHQIWYADRVAHVWGQAQRVCNKCTNIPVQQNAGDGHVCVRGQKEFDFRLPLNKLVHCNGACDSEDPGLSAPPNGERRPYASVQDWDLVPIRPMKESEVEYVPKEG